MMIFCFSIFRVFLFSLFTLLGFSLKGAMIQMNDGSKIKGKIIVSEKDFVSIENSLFGILKIPKNSIISIAHQDQTPDKKKEIELINKKNLINSNSEKNQHSLVQSKNAQKKASSYSKKNTLSKLFVLIKKIPDDWKSELGFEFKGQSGNTEKEAYATEISTMRKTKNDLFKIKLYYAKEETNGIDSKDQSKYSAQYDNYFYEKFGWFVRQDFELDQIIQIDYQSISSLGLAYRFIDNNEQQLRARIGLGFNKKVYQNYDTEEQLVGDIGIAHQYKYSQWTELTSELKIVPSFKSSDDFTINHESGITIPLAKKSWKIRFGMKNKYRNIVQNSIIEKLDSQYYSKVIFNF